MPPAKFSDNSVVVGVLDEMGMCRNTEKLVDNFVEWCSKIALLLNVNKIKEMVVNFSRKRPSL